MRKLTMLEHKSMAVAEAQRRRAEAAEARERVKDQLLREALDSRAPDYAEVAHPRWHDRVRAALAQQPAQGERHSAHDWNVIIRERERWAYAEALERAAQVADARREQWSCAGGFGGHSAAARIIASQIRNLRGDQFDNDQPEQGEQR